VIGRPDRPRRRLRLPAVLALVLVTGTACEVPNFGFPDGITVQSERILRLWKGSSIVALAVGAFVWGLILFAVVAYRKRNDELPRQVRYNLPVETLYTVIPFVIVAGLFYYTARDEIEINELTDNPQLTVGVVGFRWNWQFDYQGQDPQGRDLRISVVGRPDQPAQLVLPRNRTIRFVETSPDVIHSFWVPEFLFKRDVIPGRVNQFEVTITKTGTFVGRCAELCGVDHDRMNFSVRVVEPAEFDRFVAQNQDRAYATAAGG
jgi:cytochrome c oxidase subunit 2